MNLATRLCILGLAFFAGSGCIRTHGGDGGIGSGRAGSGPSGAGGSAGTAPNAGPAGMSAVGGRGGTGGASGFAGMGVSGSSPVEASCRESARAAAGPTQLSDKCFACTCAARSSAASRCDRNCWIVIECVLTSGCDSTDVVCLQRACVARVAGTDHFIAAAQLAVEVPVDECMAECSIPFEESDDAGE